MHRLHITLLAFLLMLSTVSQGWAGAVIDFQGLQGGTITQTGSEFVGSNINISALQLIDTPSNAGMYDVQQGVLTFDTTTATFAIEGAVAALTILHQPLLAGSLASFHLDPLGAFFLATGTGQDTKATDLLTAAGLSPTPFAFSLTAVVTAQGGTAGVYHTFSTDVANTPVPEPASILLVATGLIVLGLLKPASLRKQRNRAQANYGIERAVAPAASRAEVP